MANFEPNISTHARNSLKDFRDSLSTSLTVGGSALTIAGIFNPLLVPFGAAGVAAGAIVKAIPLETPQRVLAR